MLLENVQKQNLSWQDSQITQIHMKQCRHKESHPAEVTFFVDGDMIVPPAQSCFLLL